MSNRNNLLQFVEKGQWHKGNTGAELDNLSRNRYIQIQTAIETAKKSITNQLSFSMSRKNIVSRTNTAQSAGREVLYEKTEAVASARKSVDRALSQKAGTR